MREMKRTYLKDNDISIKDGTVFNAVRRDMMSVSFERSLDGEPGQKLDYSKYDYRYKDTAAIFRLKNLRK